MFFYEGQSCPVCGKHFAENDDIVTCPQCGCPHHRECWKLEGHCHFAADHGTENQWAVGSKASPKKVPLTTKKCRNCGAENPEFAEFCAQCGRDLDHVDWAQQPTPPAQQYTPPAAQPFRTSFQPPLQDPYGGIPRDTEIEGITVNEIVDLVGPNAAYYVPQFLRMSQSGSKTSWNWAGFLLPHNWLLFRKNIVWGIVASVLWTVICLASYLVMLATESIAFANADPALLSMITVICTAVELALRLTVGLLGNYAYMQSVLRKARKLREHPQSQYNRNFSTSGGTSLALAIIPYAIPFFIAYALMLFSPIP